MARLKVVPMSAMGRSNFSVTPTATVGQKQSLAEQLPQLESGCTEARAASMH